MTAAEKAAEKAKQETAQGAAPASTTTDRGAEGTLDFTPQSESTLVAETPEWATDVLKAFSEFSESLTELSESKAELLEVGKSVIQAVADFKEAAGPVIQEAAANIAEHLEADPDADYEVAKGKEFRHPNDFNRKYREGDDVSSLPTATLTRLLNSGLIVES